MTIAQRILDCNSQKQVVELVDSQAKAILRDWKRNLLEEALEDLVTKFHGPKWLKIRESKPTPWVCVQIVVQEGVIKLSVMVTISVT